MRSRFIPLLTALSLLLPPAAAEAQTFDVNTDQDLTVAGGCVSEPQCSLRDAIAAAQASADETNLISVPAGHYGLSQGELTISDTGLTIRGAGARGTTIDAGGASRVMTMSGTDDLLEALTITGGAATLTSITFPGDGGGILLNGSADLTLNQVAVNGNTAALNGGGISAPPESALPTAVTINGSTISGNRVTGGVAEGLGGGVYTLGDVTVTNSTIAGNSVENPGLNAGGGIFAGLDPADTTGSTLVLASSTIAGNSVGMGGMGGGLSVDNPTAGVATTLEVRNTIIAGNTSGGAAADCFGILALTSASNISGDASCMFGDAGSRTSTDPRLGPLADNGGETDTLAPSAESVAIEGGTNEGCPPVDQRGIARPLGPVCDVGAVEQSRASAQPSADLRLKLKAKPKKSKPGGKVTFTLTLSNLGPGQATGVEIGGKVPSAARKAKGKASSLRCKLAKPRKKKGRKAKLRGLSCKVGALDSGQTRSLKLVVKKAPRKGKLKANAKATATSTDPSPGNAKAKVTVPTKKKKKKR